MNLASGIQVTELLRMSTDIILDIIFMDTMQRKTLELSPERTADTRQFLMLLLKSPSLILINKRVLGQELNLHSFMSTGLYCLVQSARQYNSQTLNKLSRNVVVGKVSTVKLQFSFQWWVNRNQTFSFYHVIYENVLQ